jgi:hypothetical protein
LIKIVVTRVDTFSENVVFLSPEELEQGEKYGKLPVKDSCGSHVEGIYVEGQDRKQVGE